MCSRFNTDALFSAAGTQKPGAVRPVFKFWLHHLAAVGPLHAGPFLGRRGEHLAREVKWVWQTAEAARSVSDTGRGEWMIRRRDGVGRSKCEYGRVM